MQSTDKRGSSGSVGLKWWVFNLNIKMNFLINRAAHSERGWPCVTSGSPSLAVFKPNGIIL